MKKNIHSFILFLASLSVQSQNYTPDKILIDNKEYDYRFHHLEKYFNYYPEKRIVPTKDSTIINRGYIAHFEIYDNEIYLRDLYKTDLNNLESKNSIRDKFSNSKAERIPLRWVNGVVYIGIGDDQNNNDSLHPINTKNLIFEIQKGKIERKITLGKEEMRLFKKNQWNKYKFTHDYLIIYSKLRNLGLSDIEINQHIFNNIFYYSKKIHLQK